MREILFRGKENGQWVCGYYWKYEKDGKEIHVIRDTPDKLLKFNHIVEPETVGQYTGLTDNNGRKIFEGDIIQYTYNYRGEAETNFLEVRYSIEQARFCPYFNNGVFNPPAFQNCVVVGNVFDDPDLLEDEEEEAND